MSEEPIRASHRMMQSIIKANFAGQGLDPRPEDFERVSSVFKKAGGSWESVFKGAIKDVTLLKRVLQIAVKKHIITKQPQWETKSGGK